MATRPHLIFCAGRSARYAAIAASRGFLYGCRSDRKPSRPPDFVDVHWQQPDWTRHAAYVREYRPLIAVAPDVLDLEAASRTIEYARALAESAEYVVVVPKVDILDQLPREPWLVLGYSVPSTYGGTDLFVCRYSGWPVHLLGGTPSKQLELARYLDVFSADGNATLLAARYGTVWDGGWIGGKRAAARVPLGPDLAYRAFDYSCARIREAWA